MKCLSIRQPWAWAIIHAGKDFENRTWGTTYRGPLLIHAGKTFDKDDRESIEIISGIQVPEGLPLGGIVGQVEITDCIKVGYGIHDDISPWLFGEFGWRLANPRPLPFTPMKGRLGLFEVEWPPSS